MVDFLDELQEDLRQERWMALWRRIGAYVVAISGAIVVITAGVVFWKSYQKNSHEAAVASYAAAVNQLKARDWQAGAEALAPLVAGSPQGIRILASLQQANALKQAGKSEEALVAYMKVAEDRNSDTALRGVARLNAAQIQQAERAAYEEIRQTLLPLIEDDNSPLRLAAAEHLAVAALEAGDIEQAREMLVRIETADAVPASMRERVSSLVASVAAKPEAE